MTSNIGNGVDPEVLDYDDFLREADGDLALAAIAVLPRTALLLLIKEFTRTINQMLIATDKDDTLANLDPALRSECEKITSNYIKALSGSPLRSENHPKMATDPVIDFWNAYLNELQKINHLPSLV